MTNTVRPFLLFQGEGAAALDFYQSVFPDARINAITLYGPGDAAPEGTIKQATFSIGGQEVLCTDSVVKHPFSFTPSFSFFIDCESEEWLRHLAGLLMEGGRELMPAGEYGFSRLFAWINDRFGVSWQLNYA